MSYVTFNAQFKKERIRGFLNIYPNSEDVELLFYDEINGITERIPANPNDKDFQFEYWCDYDYLTTIFKEHDIIQYLVDFAEEKAVIILAVANDGEAITLTINGDD